MVMLDRGDYWQCAYVIPKGGDRARAARGSKPSAPDVAKMSPFLADRIGELQTWDDVKLLTVTVDRLRKWWRPGLLCIGDAAHAMSPIGGVGINIAVQDAVAAANMLAAPLARGGVTDGDPRPTPAPPPVAHPRHPAHQVVMQRRIISPVLSGTIQYACHSPCGCCNGFPGCAACRPAWWGSACGLNISARRMSNVRHRRDGDRQALTIARRLGFYPSSAP